jgi:hypothetical protein
MTAWITLMNPPFNTRKNKMKKHQSSIAFGFLGLLVGFTLCYVVFVIPSPEIKLTASTGFPPQLEYYVTTGQPTKPEVPKAHQSEFNWDPYLIQPTLPPKIVGRYYYNGK